MVGEKEEKEAEKGKDRKNEGIEREKMRQKQRELYGEREVSGKDVPRHHQARFLHSSSPGGKRVIPTSLSSTVKGNHVGVSRSSRHSRLSS